MVTVVAVFAGGPAAILLYSLKPSSPSAALVATCAWAAVVIVAMAIDDRKERRG